MGHGGLILHGAPKQLLCVGGGQFHLPASPSSGCHFISDLFQLSISPFCSSSFTENVNIVYVFDPLHVWEVLHDIKEVKPDPAEPGTHPYYTTRDAHGTSAPCQRSSSFWETVSGKLFLVCLERKGATQLIYGILYRGGGRDTGGTH